MGRRKSDKRKAMHASVTVIDRFTLSGQGRRFRPAKSQKHPPSISYKRSSTSRCSGPADKEGHPNHKTAHTQITGESGTREETRLVVMTTEALPSKSVDGLESMGIKGGPPYDDL